MANRVSGTGGRTSPDHPPSPQYIRDLRKIMCLLLQSSLYVAAGSLGLVLASNSAQALTVQATVNGITYDGTTFTGSFNSNAAKFEALANNDLMPWWGNGSLAAQFANAASAPFGLPNDNGNLQTFFAYAIEQDIIPYLASQAFDSSGTLISPSLNFGDTWT